MVSTGWRTSRAQGNPKLQLAALGLKLAPHFIADKLRGQTKEMTIYDLARDEFLPHHGAFPPSLLWLYHQGGFDEVYGRSADWDPAMKRPLSSFIDKAVEKGWQLKPRNRPRIFMEAGGNVLRRFRAYDVMIEKLLPKLDLMVTIDWRMSNTALYSDYVLPAAAWYEKDDITWATASLALLAGGDARHEAGRRKPKPTGRSTACC